MLGIIAIAGAGYYFKNNRETVLGGIHSFSISMYKNNLISYSALGNVLQPIVDGERDIESLKGQREHVDFIKAYEKLLHEYIKLVNQDKSRLALQLSEKMQAYIFAYRASRASASRTFTDLIFNGHLDEMRIAFPHGSSRITSYLIQVRNYLQDNSTPKPNPLLLHAQKPTNEDACVAQRIVYPFAGNTYTIDFNDYLFTTYYGVFSNTKGLRKNPLKDGDFLYKALKSSKASEPVFILIKNISSGFVRDSTWNKHKKALDRECLYSSPEVRNSFIKRLEESQASQQTIEKAILSDLMPLLEPERGETTIDLGSQPGMSGITLTVPLSKFIFIFTAESLHFLKTPGIQRRLASQIDLRGSRPIQKTSEHKEYTPAFSTKTATPVSSLEQATRLMQALGLDEQQELETLLKSKGARPT